MKHKDIFAVPYWVDEARRRHGFPVSSYANYEELSKFASPTDQIAILSLNGATSNIVGETSDKFVGLQPAIPYMLWKQKASNAELAILESAVYPVRDEHQIDLDVKTRCFGDPEARHEERFIIYDATPEVAVVVVNSGFKVNDSGMALVEAVLKLFTSYQAYHDVAKSPWYRLFLKLL